MKGGAKEMDEEKSNAETKEVQTEIVKETKGVSKENTIHSRTETALPVLKEAQETAARIEKANEETKKLLNRQEKLLAEQMLAGKSVMEVPEPKKPETTEEYANRVAEGKANPLREDGII